MDGSFAVGKASSHVFEDYQKHLSAPQISTELAIISSLRGRYPDWTVTVTPAHSTGLIAFAKAGQAIAELETEPESFSAWRTHVPVHDRTAKQPGQMKDTVHFGKYNYYWNEHSFIVYSATFSQDFRQIKNHYILHKRDHELDNSRCHITDELITASTQWNINVHDEVLVFDQEQWTKNKELWASVQNSSWDDVIMEEAMKDTLVKDVEGFFDCRDDYKDFQVPWKRGIIFHGLPGNGKTISIKALMHALYIRPDPIPTLYVKSLAGCHGPEYAIREIFTKARQSTPCLLVFEDLDSLITDQVKSFFLNEVDGLESNEGLMMLATAERVKYCNYWRSKLAQNKRVEFPPELSEAIADITGGFSFAYLKELFISSLLHIVGAQKGTTQEIDGLPDGGEEGDKLRHLVLWRVINRQVETLRAEMEEARKSAEDAANNNESSDISQCP